MGKQCRGHRHHIMCVFRKHCTCANTRSIVIQASILLPPFCFDYAKRCSLLMALFLIGLMQEGQHLHIDLFSKKCQSHISTVSTIIGACSFDADLRPVCPQRSTQSCLLPVILDLLQGNYSQDAGQSMLYLQSYDTKFEQCRFNSYRPNGVFLDVETRYLTIQHSQVNIAVDNKATFKLASPTLQIEANIFVGKGVLDFASWKSNLWLKKANIANNSFGGVQLKFGEFAHGSLLMRNNVGTNATIVDPVANGVPVYFVMLVPFHMSMHKTMHRYASSVRWFRWFQYKPFWGWHWRRCRMRSTCSLPKSEQGWCAGGGKVHLQRASII